MSSAPLAWARLRLSGPFAWVKNSVKPSVDLVTQTQTAPLGVVAVAVVLAQARSPPFGPAG